MRKILKIHNNINELNKVAALVEEVGDELQLTSALIFNLNLVLEEAVSNIIYYAYPKQAEHEIVVQAELVDKSLVFTLTDSGKPFDPTQVAEADITLPVEERQIGGLGIFLIKQIMNEVEYQRIEGMNVFTLKKVVMQ